MPTFEELRKQLLGGDVDRPKVQTTEPREKVKEAQTFENLRKQLLGTNGSAHKATSTGVLQTAENAPARTAVKTQSILRDPETVRKELLAVNAEIEQFTADIKNPGVLRAFANAPQDDTPMPGGGSVRPAGDTNDVEKMAALQSKRDALIEEYDRLTGADNRTWFKKGAFEDGYQRGDVPKTVIGTTADAAEKLITGGLTLAETGTDAAVYVGGNALDWLGRVVFGEGWDTTAMIGRMRSGKLPVVTEGNSPGQQNIADIISEDFIDERATAKTFVSDPLKAITGVDTETDSVLGEKTDALMQSAGQLAAQYGLSLVGVPWFVTSGVSSFGSETESALRQGATLDEAGVSGAITAGAEILTEKLFGGDVFVKNAGFDVLTDEITKGIASKFVRKAAQFGLNAAGEGTEEWVSQRIGQFGQWLTYKHDEKELLELLYSEESIDEALEAFFSGAALGGGMSAIKASIPNAAQSVQTDATPQGENTQAAPETAAEPAPGSLEWVEEISELGKPTNTSESRRLTEADMDSYMRVGERRHVRDAKQRIFDNGESPILTKPAEIVDFIRNAFRRKIQNTVKGYGRVNNRLANAVKSATNGDVNIDDYYLELDADKIAHISDHVKQDKDIRNIPLSEEQLEQLPEYIDNYDDLIDVIRRKDGSVRLMLGKKINGHSIILETVSKGRKSLHPVTAYQIDSADYMKYYKTRAIDRSSTSRPANADTVDISRPAIALNDSIPQTVPGVNTNSSQTAQPDPLEMVQDVLALGQGKENGQTVDTESQTSYDNENGQGGTNNAEGLQQNDRAGGIGDPAQGMAGIQQNNRSGAEGQREHGGVAGNSGILRVSQELIAAQQHRGTPTYSVHDTTSTPESYEQALIAGRNSDTKNGWCVTPKTAQELKDGNVRTFMNSTGTVGVGVAPDGDIVAVFKNKVGGPPKALDTAMPIAIEQGGDRLDCYGEGLVKVYSRYGFIPVARVEFNPEYANEGWTPDKGTPYIYVMMHNGDSAAQVAENVGNYPVYTKEQRDALPTYSKDDYDAAMAYRDSLMSGKGDSSRSSNPTESVGAAPSGFDPNSHLQYQYGTLPEGKNAVRPDDLPVSTDGSNRVSQTAVTVKGARVTSDEFADLLTKDVTERNGMTYIPITNNATVQKAMDHISEEGWLEAKAQWQADVRYGKAGADMSAIGALLLNNAAKAGDKTAWLDILHDYQLLGTNTAQGMQALQILKKLSPSDKLYMAKRSVKQMVKDMKLDTDVTIDPELEAEYNAAETDQQRDAVLKKIQKNVAQQLPTTFMEKFTAWRYVNMLGNLRTQGRNIVGNLTMMGTRAIHNAVATGLEVVVNKASGGKTGRTRSVTVSKEQRTAAAKDFDGLQEYILDGSKYNDNTTATGFAQGVQEQKQIFKFKPLEGYRKVTNWMMEQGDVIFARDAYARALAGYLKANGITETDYSKVDPAIMDDARLFAAKEAQEATFRDTNWLSSWVSKIGRRKDTPAVGKLISEGIMPFRKTPANVLVRAEEYSPLGIINSVALSVKAAQNGSDVTATQVINSWAKTLTGTGLFGVGMLLHTLGLLSAGPEDDEQKEGFEDLNGWQDYALILPDGTNLTIDCFSPSSIPVLMGAQLMKQIGENGFQLKDLEAALTSIAEPLVEMSMLQGINDSLENIQYADSNLGQFAINAAVSYLTQGLTNTLAGQLERSFEDSRMQTYVDKDSELPTWLQRTLGKASAKTPGLDYSQIPYINAWGEEEENPSTGLNLVYNLLSPSYFDKGKDDDLTRELNRLNDAQGENVYPSIPDKTLTVNEQDYNLSADEYVALAKLQGKTQKQLVEDLISSSDYAGLSDEDKAKAIRSAYEYARDSARGEVVEEHPGITTKWMKELKGDIAEGIIRHIAADGKYTSLSVSDASYVDDLLDGLIAEKGKTNVRDIQRIEAIADSKLSEKDQKAVLKDTLDDKGYEKYLRILATGVDTDDYATSYRLYLDAEGGTGKKARTIAQFQKELNVSKSVAEKLYDIYSGKK